MVAYWDATLLCRFSNRAYEKWFGVDPATMVGRNMQEFLGPLFALNLPYIQGVLRGHEQTFEREIPDPAGGPPRYSQAHYIPDLSDGKVRGFYVLVADITRRKKAEQALVHMERQLQATERLVAMATLAAGIAHEINNPLAAVLANIELALEGLAAPLADPASLNTPLVEAANSTRRIRDIVQSMKLLARGDTAKREPVDLNDTIAKSIEFSSTSVRYRARVVLELAATCHVDANASQLAQVFVNLLVNAAQALPEEAIEHNEIRVSSRREGDLVMVEVSDNGCGIPEELQARIFEPFFTTKDVGSGLGLGLSISSAIVNAFGGKISVRSKPGEGSVFRIALPVVSAPAPPVEAATRTADESRPQSPAVTGRPSVLVVDDQAMVATLLARVLSDGCDVVVKNGGREAIALLTASDPPWFDLVLCDLMMPGVSGEKVFAEVTAKRPELTERFIFMTGGAFTPTGRHFLETTNSPVLEKPFDLARLRAIVDTHLNRSSR